MRLAADYRTFARKALGGLWGRAICVSLVASILTSVSSVTNYYNSMQNSLRNSQWFYEQTTTTFRFAGFNYTAVNPSPALVALFSVLAIVAFLIGGALSVGRSRFDLQLAAHEDPPFSTLFSGFAVFWKAFALNFLIGLFVGLWTLLFIVPGIVAAYRYALAPFIMAENPDIGPLEAISESKRLMMGNKGRLFCLQFSFIGWFFLSLLTMGIGLLWLSPYMNTAVGAFYLDVTGQEARLTGQQAAV